MIEAGKRNHNRGMVHSGRAIVSTYLAVWAICFCVVLSITASAQIPTDKVQIMNAHSGLCLSPAGGSDGKNVEIVQFTCDQEPSRFWTFVVAGGGIVKIRNSASGLCLTIAGGQTGLDIASVQYPCDGDPSRRWHYTVVDGTRFRLVNVKSDLCLTIAGGATARNTTAVQYPCDGDPSRDWKIKPIQHTF